jgi:tRNA-2-methylthio-N6-dimethylallyladenosine synthase
MNYYIITIGCQMNKSDSERISFYLEKAGFLRSSSHLDADLVIIVTCGVRQSSEDRVYGLVDRILKKRKDTVIVVTGCLSDRPDVQRRLEGKANIFLNISDLNNLNKYLHNYFPKIKKHSKKVKNYLEIESKRESSFSAFVPIGNGCDNFCSYCVVPYARGREVYRPASDIIKEVRGLIDNGYKEINLIAQNVNSYKSTVDFAGLLEKINNIPGNFWIRFSTSHPKDISPRLIKALKKCDKICEHFHLAVQSGDDDILKKMNRGYKADDYIKIVKKIRQSLDYKNGFPASITTDMIVGFPGETRKKFLKSVSLVRKLSFDLIYIGKYSPRHGTASCSMRDDVSLKEKKRRELELTNALKKTVLKNNKFYLNKEVEILVEGIDSRGNLFGKTRTSKLVRIKSFIDEDIKRCDFKDIIGDFFMVHIDKILEFELHGCLLRKSLSSKKKAIALLGPTSSGKTSLAVKLAYHFDGEIVSADSRQVYKGMDIGTGKDLLEYNYKGRNIPYHLIDVASPRTTFSLSKYQEKAFRAIDDIIKRGKVPILTGGSGLYLEAVVDNYILSDVKTYSKKREEYESLSIKELHKKIKDINTLFFSKINDSDLKNKRRLARYLEILLSDKSFSPRKSEAKYNFLILGLNPARSVIRERIYKRLLKRIEDEGMIEEVKRLRKSGVSFEKLDKFGLEYRFVSQYLQKKINYQQLVDKLFIAICRFSKRQMSWFRRWEKLGANIFWINNYSEARLLIKKFLK